MKKFIVMVILIVVAAGACFLAGWLQFFVPLEAYGVLHSKTHGLHDKTIHEGTFDWLWYRLIPGNTKIRTYRLTPQCFQLRLTGSLPLTETLAELTGLKTDFDWALDGDVAFSIKPESLPQLTAKNNLSGQAELDAYVSGLSNSLKTYLNEQLSFYFNGGTDENVTDMENVFITIIKTGSAGIITSGIQSAFPYIDVPECHFIIKKAPDFEQWKNAKLLYTAYLNRQQEVLSQELYGAAGKKIASQFRFDELSRYGELLTKYPILIEYLGIEYYNNKTGKEP